VSGLEVQSVFTSVSAAVNAKEPAGKTSPDFDDESGCTPSVVTRFLVVRDVLLVSSPLPASGGGEVKPLNLPQKPQWEQRGEESGKKG